MPALTNLEVEWVSLVPRAAVRDPANPTEPMRFLLTKGEVPVWKREGAIPEGETMTEAEMTAAVEKAETDAKALVEKAEAAAAEAVKKAEADRDAAVAKATEKPAEPKVDEIDKSELSPAIAARLEKLEKAEADANARVEKAENLAKAEREIRVTKEFIAKAETFKSLGVDALELGPILKSASEHMPAELVEKLDGVLKAADEQVRAGDLFKEQGAGGEGKRVTNAWDELSKSASELRKSDTKLSAVDAMAAAMEQNPELQEQYLREVR